MRRARNAALVVIAICLLIALGDLLGSTTMTFSNLDGSGARTLDCGSTAFPKSLIDFQGSDDPGNDAANCAGQTSGEGALYAVLFAAVALVVVIFTARDTPTHRNEGRSSQRPTTSSAVPLGQAQEAE